MAQGESTNHQGDAQARSFTKWRTQQESRHPGGAEGRQADVIAAATANRRKA